MEPTTQRLMEGAAGFSEKKYLDEVFSTYLYKGTGSAQTITNNIDVLTKGGMTWLKKRSASGFHYWYDSLRTTSTTNSNSVDSSRNNAQMNSYDGLNQFTTSGFVVDTLTHVNQNGAEQASWTFRKEKGFFDVVTYTGTGSARTVPHDLGSVPGCIMVKRTDAVDHWVVYHRGLNTLYGGTAGQYYVYLDTDNSYMGGTSRFNDTAPTATEFTVGTDNGTNASGGEYVAYIFAHDDQSFGEGGDQSIIYHGSYTGNGNNEGPYITLGWEPQFVIIKRVNVSAEGWVMFDNMRGMHAGGDDKALFPNQDTIEQDRASGNVWPLSTGFQINGTTDGKVNGNNDKYIFIAIRALTGAVSKPPEAGTDAFAMNAPTGSHSDPEFISNFPVDYGIYRKPASSQTWFNSARIIKPNEFIISNNTAESSWANGISFDYMNGWGSSGAYTPIGTYQSWMWRRGTGFEVVNDIGTGSAKAIPHGLGKTPEMIWRKCRNAANGWVCYHKGFNDGVTPQNYWLSISSTDAEQAASNVWNNTAPTDTHFTVGDGQWANQSTKTFLTMLFASVDGISKCGFYSGSANDQTITTGFQPRLIIIKRTTAARDWLLFDTLRGIGPGANDDKVLFPNSDIAQESQNFVDLTATGFTLVANLQDTNHQDHKYIYYAHA